MEIETIDTEIIRFCDMSGNGVYPMKKAEYEYVLARMERIGLLTDTEIALYIKEKFDA